MGRKYIRLYSPQESEALYPHETHLLHNTSQVGTQGLPARHGTSFLPPAHPILGDQAGDRSAFLQVDVENPDLEKFPRFAEAPFLSCVLCPGEILFIPVQYWHYVRALDLSFSVSFWWS